MDSARALPSSPIVEARVGQLDRGKPAFGNGGTPETTPASGRSQDASIPVKGARGRRRGGRCRRWWLAAPKARPTRARPSGCAGAGRAVAADVAGRVLLDERRALDADRDRAA